MFLKFLLKQKEIKAVLQEIFHREKNQHSYADSFLSSEDEIRSPGLVGDDELHSLLVRESASLEDAVVLEDIRPVAYAKG